ncbi:RagB/SusD family nutrient uptake outer membrane protein [Tamlana sp. 2201CG12-4]|uniref:RagB/SusD family nutrient uptake outer membrane protein n=1 Tax=Tamlana sp. 2201CG12-4 TaxID=3112582 RepID=UPI002DC023F5|nr:RagB/SusD family nutrient uptake outer membrane protein [Tamlana sp. 2201CG12-4]MEC3908255.1 RagB/SusD family nutrient uptake outer membrane protein [Tamlana sp. 2201CG12-4]
MKNIFKSNSIFKISFLILVLGLASCEDKVLNLESLDQPNTSAFFNNADEAEVALTGAYRSLFLMGGDGMPQKFYEEVTLTDNGYYRFSGGDRNAGQIEQISLGTNEANDDVNPYYSPLYRGLGRANFVIDNMEANQDLIEADRYGNLLGQALVLRAYYHSMLVQYFGDITYIDKFIIDPADGFISRSPRAEVVDKILAELDRAAGLLNASPREHNRITKAVALGLKARVALYEGQHNSSMFAVAAQAAKDAMDASAGIYGLSSNYYNMFQEAGEKGIVGGAVREVMLTMPFEPDFRSHQIALRTAFRGQFRGFFQCHPSQNLVDAYPTINGLTIDEDPAYDPTTPWENRDPRLKATILTPGDSRYGVVYESHLDSLNTFDVNGERIANRQCPSFNRILGGMGYAWKKYSDEPLITDGITDTFVDYHLMRYAEILLIRAEAEIESGGDLQAAANALQQLRDRAYIGSGVPAPVVQVASQAEMRRLLRIERRIELALEGFRLVDLNRWQATEKVRNEPLKGRVLDLPSAGVATVPVIDNDGVTIYTGNTDPDLFYDGSFGVRVASFGSNQAIDSNGNPINDPNLHEYIRVDGTTGDGNWQNIFWTNFLNRGFTAPRDYLLPIPLKEINLFNQSGVTLEQNPGY